MCKYLMDSERGSNSSKNFSIVQQTRNVCKEYALCIILWYIQVTGHTFSFVLINQFNLNTLLIYAPANRYCLPIQLDSSVAFVFLALLVASCLNVFNFNHIEAPSTHFICLPCALLLSFDAYLLFYAIYAIGFPFSLAISHQSCS